MWRKRVFLVFHSTKQQQDKKNADGNTGKKFIFDSKHNKTQQ